MRDLSEDEIRRAVERVLAREEFQPHDDTILERAGRTVLDFLGNVLAGAEGEGATTILAWIVVLATLAITGWWLSRLLRRLDTSSPRPRTIETSVARDGASWRAEAEAHEQGGDLRGAVRCRYRALLADLADRAVFDERPGRTVGELEAAVRNGLPAAGEAFGRASNLFQSVWYGRHAATREDVRALERLANAVLGATP